MKRIFNILGLSPKKFAFGQFKCIILILSSSISSLFFPFFLGKIIDQGMDGLKDIKRVSAYLIALIFSGILMAMFQYMQNVCIYKLEQDVSVQIKENIYAKCTKGNCAFWNYWKTGDVLRIMGEDIVQIENTITIIWGQLLVHVFMLTGISTMIFYYSRSIGLVSIVFCLFLVVVQKKIGKQIEKESFVLRGDVEIAASYTNETINNMMQFTISGLGGNLSNKFNKITRELSQKAIIQAKRIATSKYIGMMYNVTVVSFALVIGIRQINAALLTMGELYIITIFVQRLYSPIIGISDAYLSIRKILPIVSRITKILNSEDVIEDGNIILTENINSIQFYDVSFSYDGKRSLLSKLDIKIYKGQIVGIVGENGTGKSTIIRLLLKMCKCTSGKIEVNGKDISDIDIDYIQNQISVMHQEGNLLSGAIKNIVNPLGKTVSDETIYYLLRKLAFDFNRFPNGLDTVINAYSTNLSGGERQKLDLIRVIIEDKPVVIFDEPTSALDLESENLVCDLLQNILTDKIAIVITHRESIIKICTMVIRI